MPKPRTVHRGSVVAQGRLYPLKQQVRLSATASGLLQDVRNTAAAFGQATEATAVEAAYVTMQMRVSEMADYISKLEHWHGTRQDAVVRF